MRKVDRSVVNEPPSLSAPSAAVTAEKNAASAFYATYVSGPKYEFTQYKAQDVKAALRLLFHGNCAYCESDLGDDLDVEHFRPKGGITGEPTHHGYWWLAHSWTNLLPSCTPCNRKRAQHLVSTTTTSDELLEMMSKRPRSYYGKANHFPVSGPRAFSSADEIDTEKPLLLDPTADDPRDYLFWTVGSQYSVVLPRLTSAPIAMRAEATISIFALNRLHLVQSRTKVLSVMRALADKIVEQLEKDSERDGDAVALARAIFQASALQVHAEPGQPYSAMAMEFIEDFLNKLQAAPRSSPSTDAKVP